MAGIAFDSILSSRPYTFLVGPQKRAFFIHASLAASKSSVLDAVVSGSMKEATDGYSVWEEVDEDTFVRFGQYVYTGDYEGSAPSEPRTVEEVTANSAPNDLTGEACEPESSAEAVAADEPAPDEPAAEEPVPARHGWGWSSTSKSSAAGYDGWGYAASSARQTEYGAWPAAGPVEQPAEEGRWEALLPVPKKKGKKKKKIGIMEEPVPEPEPIPEPEPVPESEVDTAPLTRNDAWDAFKNELLQDCGIANDSGTVKARRVSKNANRLLQYKQVFLSHARVHVMAVHYEIQPLAQLALRKLHRILCKFILHAERICDVVALLRYCYEQDQRPQLRKMVSVFAACHFKQLWMDVEFRELFSAYGELSGAIVENLIKRLD